MRLFFIFISVATSFLLLKSIYHLIKAISNFKTGYDYYLLPVANELHNYQTELEKRKNDPSYQIPHPPAVKIQNVSRNPNQQQRGFQDKAEITFEDYILKILIKCITKNQQNNDIKLYQRFLCIRYLSFAILCLSFLIIPLSNKNNESATKKIEISLPAKLEIKKIEG